MASSPGTDQEATSTNGALATIDRLPSEVLCLIFEALARTAFVLNVAPTSSKRLGWLVATHVCRSWRTAAIEHKLIWCFITTTHVNFFRMFAERSGDLPLHVYAATGSDHTRSEHYPRALLSQISRVVLLTFVASDDLKFGICSQLQDALNGVQGIVPLEFLNIDFKEPRSFYSLSTKFFNNAPSLGQVSLAGISFPKLAMHTGIRLLQLRDNDEIDLQDIYDVLRGVPNLEAATLDNAWGAYDFERANEPVPLIVLPRLKLLQLNNSFWTCSLLLQNIETHPHAQIDTGFDEIMNFNPWNDLQHLHSYLERHPLPAVVSVQVSSAVDTDLNASKFFTVDASFLSTTEAEMEIRQATGTLYAKRGFKLAANIQATALVSPNGVSVDPSFQLLSSPTFYPASWVSLSLRGSFFWLGQHFVDVFSSAVNVRDICLYSVTKKTVHCLFVQLASHLVHEHDTNLPISPLLPELHTILLDDITLDCPHKTCQESNSITETIRSTLQKRHAAGHPIKHIFINNCSGVMKSVHVEGWGAGYGCEVRWDGRGRADHSHEHDEVVECLEGLVVS